jgi:3-deoxy-manno-octulosonate cytidylyltransferase (CMP-KDO synthetase)
MRIGKVVIPCRLESERLPKKMMIDVFGKPMIEHVWRRACLAVGAQDVVIVTDSELIASHMTSVGADVYISQLRHENGTSRVSEFLQMTSYDFALILQGDELLVRPSMIQKLFIEMSYGADDFINAVSPLGSMVDLQKTDIVKCWVDPEGYIRFFFRGNPLRDSSQGYEYFKIVNGLFAISRKALQLGNRNTHGIEYSESIEQFVMLKEGILILAHEVENYVPSVNTKEELDIAIELLFSDTEQKLILRSMFKS